MADWLLLRLPRADTELATWLVVDARGAPSSPPQSGPLALAAARTPGRRVCVLVSGAEVLLAEPDVPVKAGAKVQQLVPYALEEQLADDIEDLHFALGKRSSESSRVPVAVIAKALLEQWLAELRGAGIEPDAVYADSELLPHNPGQAVALLEADTVSVRPPGGTPVTLPADALGEALEIARTGAEASATGGRGLILYTGAPEWHQHSAQVEAARPHFDGIKVQLLAGGPLGLYAQQLPSTTAINLLQGSFAWSRRQGVACGGDAACGARWPAHHRQDGRTAAAQTPRAATRCFDPRHLPQLHAYRGERVRGPAADGKTPPWGARCR
jgi:general secretion pathway protein L